MCIKYLKFNDHKKYIHQNLDDGTKSDISNSITTNFLLLPNQKSFKKSKTQEVSSNRATKRK